MKILFFLSFAFASPLFSLNLEERADDFVMELKRIELPGYPDAFNPSIVKWRDSFLMSFRKINLPNQSIVSAGRSEIGLVWLDENFNPEGAISILKKEGFFSQSEDARLINIDERLYIIYSNNEEEVVTDGGFRMYIAELEYDGGGFSVQHVECLRNFENESKFRREKNWVPFEYEDNLLLAYSLDPHRIVKPLWNSESCETVISTDSCAEWHWGELRGGTPALFNGDEYIAIFHSCKNMATEHSYEKMSLHYFMGAYTFSSSPPFQITQMSPEPFMAQGFYSGASYEPYWKPVKVVFPCGLLLEEDCLWVSYGRDDHEIWIAKLDREKLFQSLAPVVSKQS